MTEIESPAPNRSLAEQRGQTRSGALVWFGIALAVAALTGIVAIVLRRRRPAPRPLARPPQPQSVLNLQGLTEEEAARRLEEQDDDEGTGGTLRFKPPYSTRQIWRANTLTIFNLSMVGLGVVQVLLGKPLDAFLTTLVMLLGIGLNAGQQLWARGRLKGLEQMMRSQATVVRDSVVRSIDPAQVVRGDVLVVGPGDQILADGRVLGAGPAQEAIVVDESMLTGDPRQHHKAEGDKIYAGSFCVSGHGAYKARKVGDERLVVSLTGKFQATKEELTPLEQTMDRILRALLLVVSVLALLLLVDYFDLLLPSVHMDAFASAASVIFGLAPSSLFLMILVNYAMGTADLARTGALVHRTRSVESLAQATVLCFAQQGILTGVGVRTEPVDAPGDGGQAGHPQLADARIRQILGDYARSTTATNPLVRAIVAAFPGNRRPILDEAPFWSLYGWSAVTFDDADLRGVFVLGEPKVLQPYLESSDAEPAEAQGMESRLDAWRERLGGLWRPVRDTTEAPPDVDSHVEAPEPARQPALLRAWLDRANQAIRRRPVGPDAESADQSIEEAIYLVAYSPEPVPLHGPDGTPCLPGELVPLCHLHYAEQVRPEAAETVRDFRRTGVRFKVFSPDGPEQIAAILNQAGLGARVHLGTGVNLSVADDTPLPAISGLELAKLEGEQLAQAAMENIIFGHMAPEQAGQVVEALHAQGEAVAAVGDGVNDLPAMRQAQLSITRQASSPAALSIAEIVLLEGSSRALSKALDKGQRIANGLLDILKLYLVQIAYLGLLILAIWGMGLGFPYQSKQGSLVTIVSVMLPSLGLSLWAPAGVLPRTGLGRLLAGFVAPPAVSISAAAVVVYRLFLDGSGGEAYAQLVITYLLVISGLVLVVLLRPPVRGRLGFLPGGDERSGDWRPAALALVLLILVFVIAPLPLADQLFGLRPLHQTADYLVVGLAVLAWVFAASFLWRFAPLARLVRALGHEWWPAGSL